MAGPVSGGLAGNVYCNAPLTQVKAASAASIACRIVAHQPVRDAGGLRFAFALDGYRPRHLVGSASLLHGAADDPRPNPRPGEDRGHETYAVEAVVDRHPQAGELDR